MVLLALPALRTTLTTDPLKTTVNRIVLTARELSHQAVREQVDMLLHLDLDRGMLWTTSTDMTPEAIRDEREKAFVLPDRVRIDSVHLFGDDRIRQGEAVLRFYSRGYRDPTILHVVRSDRAYTIDIEPFLPEIAVHEGYREKHSRFR